MNLQNTLQDSHRIRLKLSPSRSLSSEPIGIINRPFHNYLGFALINIGEDMQYRSNLPRPVNKGKKIGDRKVISSTSVNGKTVHQQVVYKIDGQSVTRHERV